jgi:hypothetical protein
MTLDMVGYQWVETRTSGCFKRIEKQRGASGRGSPQTTNRASERLLTLYKHKKHR